MADVLRPPTHGTSHYPGGIEMERSDQSVYDPTHDFQGKEVWRTGTPETMLPDFPNRPGPDISIRCEKCFAFVDLPSLREHRQFHSALSTLKYTKDFPNTSDALLKRRNAILRKLKSAANKENPVKREDIERVNDAYEYLKSIVDGTFEELRQVREDVDANVDGLALNCSPECALAVGIAASGNERWKSQMEDARAFQDCFGEDGNKCYVGLFDGYHGRFAAEVAASELHKLLLHEMMKFDPRTKSTITSNLAMVTNLSQYKFDRPNTSQSERVILYDESVDIIQNIIKICEGKYEELIKEEKNGISGGGEKKEAKQKKKDKSPFALKMESAFRKVYYMLDILLSYGKDEHSKIRWSGCSAVTAVIQGMKDEVNYGKVFGELEEKDETETDDVSVKSGLEPPRDVGTIHLANVGNAHAVLVRGNRAYTVTKDHTPSNEKEKARILKEGADVSESDKEVRVNGVILTTRGLGNHGDKKLKKCILVEPYTTCVPIDQYAQFLVLATQGVWEVFSKQEAASLLLRLLPCNQIPPPSKINSTLKPLLEELNRHSPAFHSEPNSRRVSFSSVDTPRQRKVSTERIRSGTQKSPALKSVKEGATEGQDEDKRSRTGSRSEVNTPKISVTGSETPDKHLEAEKMREFQHSTPTLSSKASSGGKRTKRYIDHDMQTELGSCQGDDDDDSGNEADVDTCIDNMSPFPGTISRISMTGGPVTKEQVQRNQAKMMAEHLVQAALMAGAKDNVSVMVVLLPGCGL